MPTGMSLIQKSNQSNQLNIMDLPQNRTINMLLFFRIASPNGQYFLWYQTMKNACNMPVSLEHNRTNICLVCYLCIKICLTRASIETRSGHPGQAGHVLSRSSGSDLL